MGVLRGTVTFPIPCQLYTWKPVLISSSFYVIHINFMHGSLSKSTLHRELSRSTLYEYMKACQDQLYLEACFEG